MNLTYVSDNKIYSFSDGRINEIPCGRIEKYKETLLSIQKRKEWKTTGSGAAFMGTSEQPIKNDYFIPAKITGIGQFGDDLLYGVFLEEVGSVFTRSFDPDDDVEGLIRSSNEICFGSFDCKDNKAAISIGANDISLHISVMELPSGQYTEYTDGDTIEENPTWSADGKGIYFSTAGYARNNAGIITAVSPRSVAYLDINRNSMSEIVSDDNYDYLYPREDKEGNLYYIRQTYGGTKTNDGITIKDILLFPYRLIKGIFGFLNVFSVLFGGEALKSGGAGRNVKAKQRSEKDIIIDGNVINAEKLAKENELKGEKYVGIMPLNRVLIKREPDGTETVVKKGVLDYCIADDGIIVVSNGNHIIGISPDGNEEHIAKAKLATHIIINSNKERQI